MNPVAAAEETFQELYDKGNEYFQQGQYEKAIGQLEGAVKINPNSAPAYNLLGLAYQQTDGNLREVVWYFKTAVDIDPLFIDAYDNLAKAYYNLGMFDKAEQYCKKALEINPEYGGAQFSLAWIYLLGKSQPNEAIYYFNKVLEKAKISYAYYGLGMAYFMVDNRPMVLDTITTLRGMNEDKLAEQLENVVRDFYYMPGEEGGSLVSIKPPEAPQEEIPEALLENSHGPQMQRPRTPSFETRIEIRGSVSGPSETESLEPSVQARSTAPSSPSVLQSGPASKGSTQIKGSYVDRPSQPSSSVKKRTIEIMGSDY